LISNRIERTGNQVVYNKQIHQIDSVFDLLIGFVCCTSLIWISLFIRFLINGHIWMSNIVYYTNFVYFIYWTKFIKKSQFSQFKWSFVYKFSFILSKIENLILRETIFWFMIKDCMSFIDVLTYLMGNA